MSWQVITGLIIFLVVVYLMWGSSSNERDARAYFDAGYKLGQKGLDLTPEESRRLDPLQRHAFMYGNVAGVCGDDPDSKFDYDKIKQDVKEGFERGIY
jgi:hypothetical protein